MFGCCRNNTKQLPERKLSKEIIIAHSKTDSVYRYYGCYKEVYRIYNYEFEDTIMVDDYYKDNHWIHFFVNEYGDTIKKIYINGTN